MAVENGTDRSKAEHEIEKLKQRGVVFEPLQGHLRVDSNTVKGSTDGEDGSSLAQRERIKGLRDIVEELEEEYEEGAPYEEVLDTAANNAIGRDKAEHEIEKLKQRGEVYEPSQGHLRTT